jgi:hypothetical protein
MTLDPHNGNFSGKCNGLVFIVRSYWRGEMYDVDRRIFMYGRSIELSNTFTVVPVAPAIIVIMFNKPPTTFIPTSQISEFAILLLVIV